MINHLSLQREGKKKKKKKKEKIRKMLQRASLTVAAAFGTVGFAKTKVRKFLIVVC